MAGLRALVDATPNAPPRFGLLASATVLTGDGEWQAGVTFAPEACGGGRVADPCEPGSNVPPTNPETVEADSFWVQALDSCATFDRARDREARARRLLEACQSARIAEEFWEGNQAIASGWPNQYLANEDSDVVTTGPATPIEALACLELALADCMCGQRGMIHATRDVVTYWASERLVEKVGNMLLTSFDTIVVPDAGYTGVSPIRALPADGSVWAYATPMVTVRLGAVELPATDLGAQVNIANNDQVVVAQRLAVVTHSGCCHAAAEVNIPACGIAGS